MVPCLDCGTACRGPRCPPHQRDHKAKYSRAAGHPQLREHWKPLVATGHVTCARCAWPIQTDEAWDLGHQPDGVSKPEHANRCNRADGGRRS